LNLLIVAILFNMLTTHLYNIFTWYYSKICKHVRIFGVKMFPEDHAVRFYSNKGGTRRIL